MKSGSAEWGGTMILMDNAKRPFQILNTLKKKKHGADLLALSKAAILMCTQGKMVLSGASTIDILQLMQQLTCSTAARRHVAVETVVDDHRLGDRKLILLA